MDRVIAFVKKISFKQILTVFLAGVMVLTLAACDGVDVGNLFNSEEAPVTTETTPEPAPEAAEAPDSEAASASVDETSATSEEAPDSEAASASVDEASATSEEG